MFRILIFLVLSLLMAGTAYSRYDALMGNDGIPDLGNHPSYLPYYPAMLLLVMVTLCPVLLTPFIGFARAADITFSSYGGLFLHVSLYYLVLLALMPHLRGRISARTCAMLWVIPNVLYLTTYSTFTPPRPWLIIPLPGHGWTLLLWVWLVGLVGVLAFHIVQHLRFRRRILAPAVPATDPLTRYLWEEALKEAGFRNPKYQLVISPEVKTPLSIGLLPRCTRVVLPTRSYTREELYWVIRHEVIHLARQDSWSKFFLLFCTAICWFNPLMWVAMKSCAQDLELSCDETVLLFAHQSQRKEYAALLLNTAGDARGFTTCLSASATTLRRRLEQVLSPAARSSGAVVVGVLFFLAAITCGSVTLSYDTAPAAQVLYSAGDTAQYQADGVHLSPPHAQAENTPYTLTAPQAFHDYLSGLSLSRLMGSYTLPETDCSFFLEGPDNSKLIVISHQVMEVTELGHDSYPTYYHISQEVDWDYLLSLMEASPHSWT